MLGGEPRPAANDALPASASNDASLPPANDALRLPKSAKGKRPQFFEDPAIDALVSMVVELARETWVTRARLAALEHAAGGVDLDAVTLPPATEAALAAQRQAFIERLFRVLETKI